MAKKNTNAKEILTIIFVLLGGAAFTAASLCIYYLVKPRNPWVLSAICAADLLYTFFSMCLFTKFSEMGNKWLLKSLLLTVGYLALFLVVATLFMVFSDAIDFLKSNILGIVCYSFFTAPCAFIVVAFFILCLAYG